MVNTDTPQRTRSSSVTQVKPKVLRPFNTAEVKILLLENVNETAVKSFQKQGYQVKIPPLVESLYGSVLTVLFQRTRLKHMPRLLSGMN